MLGRLKNRIGRSLSQESQEGLGGNSDNGGVSRHRLLASPTGAHERASDYNAKLTDLQSFDVCVETADAMAAASSSTSPVQDCSIRVTPDGDLLLEASPILSTSILSTLSPSDEDPKIRDAVYMGSDLIPAKRLNGFSAMGWSAAAASLAIRQTEHTLLDTQQFLSSLSKVDTLHRQAIRQACHELRQNVGIGALGGVPLGNAQAHSHSHSHSHSHQSKGRKKNLDLKSLSQLEPMGSAWQRNSTSILDMSPHRVGPLAYSGSSLYAALVAVEQYYSLTSAEEDPMSNYSFAHQLQQAATATAERLHHREKALKEMQKKVNDEELKLKQTKQFAAKRWDMVHKAEQMVTHIMEQRMLERSKARERARLDAMELQQEQAEKNQVPFATNAEIWDIVAAATASMEDGDFAPLDLPAAPMSGLVDQSTTTTTEGASSPASAAGSTRSNSPAQINNSNNNLTLDASDHSALPMASRTDIEQECNLPQLRAVALAADDAIEDAAQNLLCILSSLDTTRRSARVAAETCLLSASHAQEASLKNLVQWERKSLQKRLAQLEQLEQVVEQVDVRSDLGLYITVDKKERGGSTWMGDDDDGGIASALAVLSSHVEGSMGVTKGSPKKNNWLEAAEQDESISTEALQDAVQDLFDPSFDSTTEILDRLCRVASDPKVKSKRSAICYALNAKRSTAAECHSEQQFESLVKLFSSILTGCAADLDDGGSVANAKMCMMLSQTFYYNIQQQPQSNNDRSQRLFIKTKLIGHPIWQQDEFWDQALHQCVTESLTHSGVMANFDRKSNSPAISSEWTQERKLQWHDLTLAERSEAASQVHAVVFAQLGALAHSMMEFGSGMDHSCAFVRRMAVRNQLPISQRTMLLQHLIGTKSTTNTTAITPSNDDTQKDDEKYNTEVPLLAMESYDDHGGEGENGTKISC